MPAPETLDRVRALLAHPAFSISNPNRVRALVGAFASANQTQFNRADGAGYDFLADFVLDLDPTQSADRGAAAGQLPLVAGAGAETRRGLAEARAPADRRDRDAVADTRDIVTRTLA